jgi:hypothetical protein
MIGIEGTKREVISLVIENLLCDAVKDTVGPEVMNVYQKERSRSKSQ